MTAWNGPVQPPFGPALVTIGDISYTQSSVHTPSGSLPIRDAALTVTDMSRTEQRIAVWAIIVGIVLAPFTCLLSLLLLLIKESTVVGQMQVTVTGPGFVHVTYIPVSSMTERNDVYGRVNYASSLRAAAQ